MKPSPEHREAARIAPSVVPSPPGALELAVFTGDAVTVHRLPASGQVSIGRSSGNDVCIDHPSVSRRHTILHLDPPLRLEDLGSANGTFVRDRRPPTETGRTHNLRHISAQTVEIALGESINLGVAMIVVRRALPVSVTSDDDPIPAPPGSLPLVVQDPAMLALYGQAYRAAQAEISVVILGETGTGKEVLAQAIHRRSPRARGPFMGLNCAALSESLLESELFGHEKGAFTGAVQARPGLFEAAEGGTVFLDEVGELPQSVQVKLLRVIEQREVLRVGARAARAIDVRFLAATNRDLEAEVARGAFREDLFFRLNGITLVLPPLRERVAEIAPLAQAFLARASRQVDTPAISSLSAETRVFLERYRWPGNIRELRNVIERAVVLCDGPRLLPEHLPAKLKENAPREPEATPRASDAGRAPSNGPPTLSAPTPEAGEAPMEKLRVKKGPVERQMIIEALERCQGNQTQAAELLGISRRTLIVRIEEYDLPRPRKK
jgi:two-component system response regulator AtoC